MICLALMLGTAAQAEPNPGTELSATSVGIQSFSAPLLPRDTDLGEEPLGVTNHNLLLGQRLRWDLVGDDDEGFRLRALADARFTIDPAGESPVDTFERNRVRQLGVELGGGPVTVDVGRHPVYRGGPRLVDGIQVLLSPVQSLEVGLWGGLAPDLFTTRARIRPGAGPIVAWTRSRAQLSVVGEVLTFEGELDRAAVLTQGRIAADRILEVSGRLDVQMAGDNGSYLSDGMVLGIWQPTEAVRIDAFYNAFSSLRYQASYLLDPELQRFANRVNQLALDFGIEQDQLDPTMNHMVGAGGRFQPLNQGGTAPRLELRTRYRHNPNPLDRFALLNPRAGLVDLPVAGRLEAMLDANLMQVNASFRGNSGITLLWEIGDEGMFAVDTSVRALMAPAPDDILPGDDLRYFDGLGWYGDLFLDWIMPIDAILIAGASYETIPDPTVNQSNDVGIGVFVQLTKYLRR